ncbi:MAG: MCE family protein [Nocardioides sp.]|jgi:phospholipid/cholesterol/gamma-HCH transport system substrate-binding protein
MAYSLVELGRRRPALLAVHGLVITAVLLAIALNASRLPFFTGTTYQAEFTDASGLQVGEEVRVAGVKVGLVRDIELSGDTVVVTFDVDGPRLGADTTAGIEVKTLLGQHYLSVTPDGPGSLDAGGTIPLSRTSTPLNVVPAFQQLTETVEEIDTGQVAEAFDAISEVLDATAPEVRATLTGLGRLSESIASRDQQIQQLFSSADGVTATLEARNDDIVRLLGDSTDVLETLNARREVIARIITETSSLARQLRGLVADNRATVGPALAKLERVLDTLRANRDALDESITLTGVYGREFTNLGGTGRFFDGAITYPRGFAVCTVEPSNALSDVLDPILTELNQAVNGSTQPCLPLGPAADSPGGGQ